MRRSQIQQRSSEETENSVSFSRKRSVRHTEGQFGLSGALAHNVFAAGPALGGVGTAGLAQVLGKAVCDGEIRVKTAAGKGSAGNYRGDL